MCPTCNTQESVYWSSCSSRKWPGICTSRHQMSKMSRGLGKNPPTPNRRLQELMHWKNTPFRFDQEYICDLCDNKICFLWKSFHDSMSQNAPNCLKIQIHWATSLLQLKLQCRYHHNHHIDHPGILEKSVSPASSAEALSPPNTICWPQDPRPKSPLLKVWVVLFHVSTCTWKATQNMKKTTQNKLP